MTRAKNGRVTLCAAITFDGKLDAADLLRPALLRALAPDGGETWLIDSAMRRKLPRDWTGQIKVIGRADMSRLRAVLRPTPGEPPVRRWLCLGGPVLFRALLDAGRVDDLCLLVRPRVDGRGGAATLSGPPTPVWFPRSLACRLRHMEVYGGECFLHYTVGRRTPRRPS